MHLGIPYQQQVDRNGPIKARLISHSITQAWTHRTIINSKWMSLPDSRKCVDPDASLRAFDCAKLGSQQTQQTIPHPDSRTKYIAINPI